MGGSSLSLARVRGLRHANRSGGDGAGLLGTALRRSALLYALRASRPSDMKRRTSSLRVCPSSPAASSSSRTKDSGRRVPTGIVSSPNHDSHPNPPNRRTPHSNSAHNPTRRTQNDYTTPQDLTHQKQPGQCGPGWIHAVLHGAHIQDGGDNSCRHWPITTHMHPGL